MLLCGAVVLVAGTTATLAEISKPVDPDGTWTVESSGDRTAYKASNGGGSISVSCDMASTPDRSGTRIDVEMGGPLPPDSKVAFVVDGQWIVMPSDNSGGVSVGACAECRAGFARLWSLLRDSRTLEVIAFDDRRAAFPLTGLATLMPVEACP